MYLENIQCRGDGRAQLIHMWQLASRLESVSLYESSENCIFFEETRTPPLRPQMPSSLHKKDRDPPNLFAA